jgi:hypothetical protein
MRSSFPRTPALPSYTPSERSAQYRVLWIVTRQLLTWTPRALGALYQGRPVGSIGEAAVFSFYATKLITTGEGGMLVSNDERVLAMGRDLREYTR